MDFSNVMLKESNKKYTENGALAYSDTGEGALLDLFSEIGALRNRREGEITAKFEAAFNEDPLLATKMMFYCGNIRGGLGERRVFRICLKWMAQNHPDIVGKNIDYIPFFNRYDSLFELLDTEAEPFMWGFIATNLISDIQELQRAEKEGSTPHISLLGKWLPSENTSSYKTRALARRVRTKIGVSAANYRKLLTKLRKQINIVESQMSANSWDEIDYSAVPSCAMKNYRHAFSKHDEDRFKQYLESLKQGKDKINASTLYPYDLVKTYTEQVSYYGGVSQTDPVIEAQWKSLPNYVSGDNNYVVMADVSASMTGRPMETSVGLAIYFAQRNKGNYHNLFMTFSNHPHYLAIPENCSLAHAVHTVMTKEVGYNTNLESAFDFILADAIRYEIKPEDMPKALIIISDMEIDQYSSPDADFSFVDVFKKKFESVGYTLPKIVFWNVDARQDTVLGRGNDVIYVSGQSVSSFGQLCGTLEGKTPYDFMCMVLNDTSYDGIRI